jgi:hypothetical protein
MVILEAGIDYTLVDYTLILNQAPDVGAVIKVKVTSGITLTADFAVSIPFNVIDGASEAQVIAAGGFDGIFTDFVDKDIIFARQENYPGYLGPVNGWLRNLTNWDGVSGWDNLTMGWDAYEYIPGYNEHELDVTVPNQQAGIWHVSKNENGQLKLTFVREVALGQPVNIVNGSMYGGKTLRYGPAIMLNLNESVPKYSIFGEPKEAIPTTFDARNTKFIDNISIYEEPDVGDKYLAFPKSNIWG